MLQPIVRFARLLCCKKCHEHVRNVSKHPRGVFNWTLAEQLIVTVVDRQQSVSCDYNIGNSVGRANALQCNGTDIDTVFQ